MTSTDVITALPRRYTLGVPPAAWSVSIAFSGMKKAQTPCQRPSAIHSSQLRTKALRVRGREWGKGGGAKEGGCEMRQAPRPRPGAGSKEGWGQEDGRGGGGGDEGGACCQLPSLPCVVPRLRAPTLQRAKRAHLCVCVRVSEYSCGWAMAAAHETS
jgi:hypothetical protein